MHSELLALAAVSRQQHAFSAWQAQRKVAALSTFVRSRDTDSRAASPITWPLVANEFLWILSMLKYYICYSNPMNEQHCLMLGWKTC